VIAVLPDGGTGDRTTISKLVDIINAERLVLVAEKMVLGIDFSLL